MSTLLLVAAGVIAALAIAQLRRAGVRATSRRVLVSGYVLCIVVAAAYLLGMKAGWFPMTPANFVVLMAAVIYFCLIQPYRISGEIRRLPVER